MTAELLRGVCRHSASVILWIVCLSVQKIPETKEVLGPRGALWCLHLHINEKLWCTLETTKTVSSLREQSSYKNMLTLKYLLCITLITLINEAVSQRLVVCFTGCH